MVRLRTTNDLSCVIDLNNTSYDFKAKITSLGFTNGVEKGDTATKIVDIHNKNLEAHSVIVNPITNKLEEHECLFETKANVSDIPTKTSDLTNDNGFITGISSNDIITALGYTPYNNSNPNGYTTNIGTVTSVNNVSPVSGNVTIPIPTVNNATLTIQKNGTTVKTFNANASTDVTCNITIPTNVSAFTNDVGYLTSATIDNISPHALKGYEDAGELLTDAEGLADVTKYAHSTFDASKFQQDGTPQVTNEGIYTPSSSNLYKLTSLSLSNASEVKIRCAFKYYSVSDYTDIISGLGGNYSPRAVLNPNGSVSLYLYDGTNLNTNVIPDTYFTNNNWYIIDWTFNNTVASYKLYDYNNILIHSDSHTASTALNINFNYWFNPLRIGSSGGATPVIFNSQIDLKQFKIWADGIPVFSGNQTGIDTIKADDYTAPTASGEALPTISADGVASGFSGTNYIFTDTLSISGASDFEFYTPYFKLGEIASGVNVIINWGSTYNDTRIIAFYRQSNSKLETQLWQGATPITSLAASTDINLNTWYQVKYIYKNSAWSTYYRTVNGDWTSIKTNITDNTGVSISGKRPIGWETSSSYLQNGELDLNGMQIYVNGNLVYQPCLKIPYTQSKTGSKVVDGHYLGRVSDMYSQFGYAPYYTLNEGTNFTVPQGEIYGYFEKTKYNIGEPIICLSSTLNDGEIWLEGSTVSRSTYANLFAVYGTTYGAGDGSTTFTLPDFRNRALWGADSFGYIAAGLPNITGTLSLSGQNDGSNVGSYPFSDGSNATGAFSFASSSGDYYGYDKTATKKTTYPTINLSAANSSSIYGNSTTVQPPSIKVRVKTRYK